MNAFGQGRLKVLRTTWSWRRFARGRVLHEIPTEIYAEEPNGFSFEKHVGRCGAKGEAQPSFDAVTRKRCAKCVELSDQASKLS